MKDAKGQPPRPVEILLVEDSPTDRLITKRALSEARILNTLNVVNDGVEAMDYLYRRGPYRHAIRPDLILLDLNLPRKDGREVLAEVKADPSLRFIPVIVLTTSRADEDIAQAYAQYANSYISKPVDFPQFVTSLRALGNYWFDVVTLPDDVPKPGVGDARKTAPPPSRTDAGGGRTIRVLVVEDNAVDVLVLKSAFREATAVTFDLTTCKRLGEAQAALAETSYDVILTDLGLPDSDGLDTYRELQVCAKGMPIIVMTGLDDEATGMNALREGAQDYLVKGQIAGPALVRAVRYAIDKKAIEEQLLQSQRLEAVGQLSSGIAHDFNNILTVIAGRADMLLSEAEGTTRESIEEIREAADRAAHLTRQLMTFSRQQVVQFRPLLLREVVGNFSKMLRRVLGEHIRLEQSFHAIPQPVLADIGQIEQVIMNLAVNARDAMPGGGKLSLSTSVVTITEAVASHHAHAYAGRFVCLAVTDTGMGIRADVLPHITEPFFTTKGVGEGTGLGLATVHSIVQQHRGWLTVESQLNQGTTFSLYFPACDDAVAPVAPGAEQPLPEPPPAEAPATTILLVEDEGAVRYLAEKILTMHGYRVIAAQDGVQAQKLWAEHRGDIDLLFTDMVMPNGTTGFDLATTLMADCPTLKVVFTSGYIPDASSLDLVLTEGQNFIQKPYTQRSLIAAISAMLASTAGE